ncbi:MAG: TrkH family potassium uptake protein [Lachnospiraceae bacterium]|nr:TrkH family potassium uptake protein [Lachnospiraceae bacterium]
MNYKLIKYIIGWLLVFESVFMLLPVLVAIVYQEKAAFSFLISMGLGLLTGGLLVIRKPENKTMYAKEGFVIVSISWIILSVFGALPFWLSGSIPGVVDALFESVSGFTTTGATLIENIEGIEKSVIFWRSFTHWIGGMGVLVFIMAILPLAGGNNIYLMRAESTGPSVNKLVPRMKTTALILYGMYFAMTIVETLVLLAVDMPLFDAVNTAFSTAGTGGFGIKNDSLAGYSDAIQNVVTIFMILFGVNFNVYYMILCKKLYDVVRTTELKIYLGILATAILAISVNIRGMYGSVIETVEQAAFQVASMMSSTGFATTDFDLWPEFSKGILVLVMCIGACAGSTGGGIKVSRIVILVKSLFRELEISVHSRNVKKIKMDGRFVNNEVIQSVNVFMVAYIGIYVVSMLILSLDDFDFTTNFTAVAAMINNTGPGLEAVGPTQNFAKFSILSKLVCIIDMLAGRLELFPVLILFAPSTWKK